MLYAIPYIDNRERNHVAVILADTPEAALAQVVEFQCQNCDRDENGVLYNTDWRYNGFYNTPTLRDVVEICVTPEDPVHLVFHEDYD